MPPIKQYVNLPQAVSDRHGRWFGLNIAISEEQTGASEGGLVYLFVEADPNNISKRLLGARDRHTGFQFVPSNRKLVIVQDGRAWAWCRLSIGGGDRFKFKAGKNHTGSGAVNSGVEVEVWRKIFVRYGFMMATSPRYSDSPTANWGAVRSEFESKFIECETDGPHPQNHQPWTRDDRPLRILDQGRAAMPFPDQSTKVVFIDRIGQKGWMDIYVRITANQIKNSASKAWYVTLRGRKYTWPYDTDWVRGHIECVDESGNVIRTYTTISHTISKKSEDSFMHPEGRAASKVRIDFSRWNMDSWANAGRGEMRIRIRVGYIDDTAMGLAWPSPPRILVATRHPTSYGDESDKVDSVTVHEIGHNLGLNVRLLPEYDESTGARDDLVQNATWYDNQNGGVGPHCNTGASLREETVLVGGAEVQRQIYRSGTCTMLHYVRGIIAFCGQCGDVLKRSDLRRLGDVWPRSWRYRP